MIDRAKDVFFWAIAGAGTLVTALLGGWDMSLQVLCSLLIIDYLVGVLLAISQGKLDSRIGARGIAKKIGYLVLVIVAAQFDQAMSLQTPLARTIAILFLIANESLSVLENLSGLGVPVPKWLVSRLHQLQEQQDNGGSDVPPPTGTATPIV